MSKTKRKEHNEKLDEFKKKLESEGWRVILLAEKSPDGIAVKNGQICAVEVLGKRKRTVGWYKGKNKPVSKYRLDGGYTFAAKKRIYSMFDDVLFETYDLTK